MKQFFTLFFLLLSIGIFSQNKSETSAEVQPEQQYKKLVADADKLMLEKNYAQAEVKYYDALQLLPGKSYAKSQLEKAKGLKEKMHQQSLLKKDSIISTALVDSVITPKPPESKLHFGPDTTVLVVSKIVGETVELNEKIRFGLLNYIDNLGLTYILYLNVKGQIVVEAKFDDGSTKFFPYSIQELISDGQKIEHLQLTPLSFSAPVIDPKRKLRLKAKKMEGKKSDTFKEGHHFYYTTRKTKEGLLPVVGRTFIYEDQYMIYAKIIKILNQGEPTIKIQKIGPGFSKIAEVIPLSDINEIAKTRNSLRFRIGDDSFLFIENY